MDTSAHLGGTPRGASMPGLPPLSTLPHNQEIYEQLLALADQVGAAYSEALERIGGAYVEAFQKTAPSFQDTFGSPQHPGWQSAMSSDATQDPLGDGQGYALMIGDHLGEMGLEVGLAYLDSVERATLAAAKCHEQLGAMSQLNLLKSTAQTRAELVRTVAKACTAALRDIVD
ncbi:MAG: hypothetical protein QOG59_353 [Solirubrobacteraceae bacterium]|nr:hypothetical protein [Solirubrobacteraceae bacterium]